MKDEYGESQLAFELVGAGERGEDAKAGRDSMCNLVVVGFSPVTADFAPSYYRDGRMASKCKATLQRPTSSSSS